MEANKVERVKDLNKAVFDRQAGTYDMKGWGRFTIPLLAHVRSAVQGKDTGSILDVGCGTGVFLKAVAEDRWAGISGVDLSYEMIKLASERLGARADLRVGDAENLPWPEAAFDVVTCSSSLHHYPQPQKALCEMKRVLRPGGRLILADVWMPVPLRQVMNSVIIPLGREGDVRVYSRREICPMVQAAGFVMLSWKRVGFLSYIAEARAI